ATISDGLGGGVVARLQPSAPCRLIEAVLNAAQTLAAATCSDNSIRLGGCFPRRKQFSKRARRFCQTSDHIHASAHPLSVGQPITPIAGGLKGNRQRQL